MAFLHLHTIAVFSSFPIILGDILQKTATAGAVDHLVTDGSQFVKRIAHGEKISDNPGYLLFTAPYKLCEGYCEDVESNFAMAFPIYVGKKGKEKYKELYPRDLKKIHLGKQNAPFKKRPYKKLFTPCPSEVKTEPTTETTTETETTVAVTSTVIPTTQTPETESTTTGTTTEAPETETPALSSESKLIVIPETEPSTVFEITTVTETPNIRHITEKMLTLAENITELPSIAEIEVTTIDEAILSTTAINKETTTSFQTEPLTFSAAEVIETEDITFETESNTTDEPKTAFVTNINGVRCPPRICNKKTKVTAKITDLVNHDDDTKDAQWNSDYSDLRDS